MTFESWMSQRYSSEYNRGEYRDHDMQAAYTAGFREASDKAATLPHRAMYDAGYEDGVRSSTPYTEGYAKGYSDGKSTRDCKDCDNQLYTIGYADGVQAERERFQPYIDQLEQAWLQLTRGNLIDGGMKVEQARIHAQARLDEAKHKILSSAIRGQGVLKIRCQNTSLPRKPLLVRVPGVF